MPEQVGLTFRGRNPDVLTCIANLSNDEVFTPPELANRMLDTLADAWVRDNDGADLWADKSVKFLDPVSKSGVFLREITTRLSRGLENEIPDLAARVDHILTKQIFGIGITHLTSLLSRRSVYCSKDAKGPHSIVKSFATSNGNIWFERTEHSWADGHCRYCGASKSALDRGEDLETHAYAFLHTDDINARLAELFGGDMQFDVIIGNPPYQLGQSGGDSVGSFAMPIYQKFVEAAKSVEPRYVVMVTPSRWFTGGRGLDEFRRDMLSSHQVRSLVDFPNAADVFPGVNINGGASYFLWDRDYNGDCDITTIAPGGAQGETARRPLDEFDIFVRRNEAISILRKVRSKGEAVFSQRVSTVQPFGVRTRFHGVERQDPAHPIRFYGSGRVTWVSASDLRVNLDWVDKWKVLVAAATDGNENYPLPIWDQGGPFVSGPGEACSETYLVASTAETEREARNIIAYMNTRFFRFLVSLRKVAQHNKWENFAFVPDLPADRVWTDAALYSRYGLTEDEVAFIGSMIRHVDFSNA